MNLKVIMQINLPYIFKAYLYKKTFNIEIMDFMTSKHQKPRTIIIYYNYNYI